MLENFDPKEYKKFFMEGHLEALAALRVAEKEVFFLHTPEGTLGLEKEELQELRAEKEQAVRKVEQDVQDVESELSDMVLLEGDKKEVRDCLRHVLSVRPESWQAHFAYGQLLQTALGAKTEEQRAEILSAALAILEDKKICFHKSKILKNEGPSYCVSKLEERHKEEVAVAVFLEKMTKNPFRCVASLFKGTRSQARLQK